MIRTTDTDLEVVAMNGDGFNSLFKKSFTDLGDLIWFTSSPYTSYWANAEDFAVLKTIISNALVLDN